MSGLMSVCWDLGTFVKHNKNQLRSYMTTGPTRLADIQVSRLVIKPKQKDKHY